MLWEPSVSQLLKGEIFGRRIPFSTFISDTDNSYSPVFSFSIFSSFLVLSHGKLRLCFWICNNYNPSNCLFSIELLLDLSSHGQTILGEILPYFPQNVLLLLSNTLFLMLSFLVCPFIHHNIFILQHLDYALVGTLTLKIRYHQSASLLWCIKKLHPTSTNYVSLNKLSFSTLHLSN